MNNTEMWLAGRVASSLPRVVPATDATAASCHGWQRCVASLPNSCGGSLQLLSCYTYGGFTSCWSGLLQLLVA
jgi:hypothetical protein